MKKYVSIIFACLFVQLAWAQSGEGYNPQNPGDPMADGYQHRVTLYAAPSAGGYVRGNSFYMTEGERTYISATPKNGYRFVSWKQNGKIVSTQNPMLITMGSENLEYTAQFVYDPSNPDNPGANNFNAATGEMVIDDFVPGALWSAISRTLGGNSDSLIQSLKVIGKMSSSDLKSLYMLSECCSLFDFARTTGYTEIPERAFSSLYGMTKIVLPYSIERIGGNAFSGCRSLSEIVCYATVPPELKSGAFNSSLKDLIVKVPSSSLSLYTKAEGWKRFTILPLDEEGCSISVSLPKDASDGRYKNMTLELDNISTGQIFRNLITDRTNYTFTNLVKDTKYNIFVKNASGSILGSILNVEVGESDESVSFVSLLQPKNVAVTVLAGQKDVTNDVSISWTDIDGKYIGQGREVSGIIEGGKLVYQVTLPQSLGSEYIASPKTEYTVSSTTNDIVCTLQPFETLQVSGHVKDLTTGSAIYNATVTLSQRLNGKYSKSQTVNTDNEGKFVATVFNAPLTTTVAANNYFSQTIEIDDVSNLEALSNVSLKDIADAAVVTTNFTYQKCAVEGETPEVLNYYSDYANVAYTIFNTTTGKEIKDFNVKYSQIVLLEEVEEGDVLEMTATSKTNAFLPVNATATINEEQRANAAFNIVELGKIKANFTKNNNAAVVGSLYDVNGKLVKSYDYNNASLTINNLTDGTYTLVTMGSSKLFNSFYDLSQLPQTGLKLGADYTQSSVEVQSGNVSVINIAEVPTLNESKLYYTGDNTSFTVNKSSIVVGNNLTLTGHLDFKSAYAKKVSNVNLIVDIPESCRFVENSVMVGSRAGSYTIQNNRITIPMARYTDLVRFCIIPTLGGDYAPSAFALFDIDGETITQPIGSAYYAAKDLSINVPPTVAKTTIPVSGTAIGASVIEIYDGGVLIGRTLSLANGTWSTKCELHDAYNLSTHNIDAKVVTKKGMKFRSENKSCVYDKNAIEVNTVTMINTAHIGSILHDYITIFDFQNPSVAMPPYRYWPSYPDFTFLVDFTKNDPEIIKNVVIQVLTSNGKIVPLTAKYDDSKEMWMVKAPFYSSSLPVNLNVTFDADTQPDFDQRITIDFANRLKDEQEKAKNEGAKIVTIVKTITDERKKDKPDNDKINNLEDELKKITDITSEKDNKNEETANDITKRWYDDYPDDRDYKTNPEINQLFVDFIVEEIEKQMPKLDPYHENIVNFITDLANEKPIIERGEYHIPGIETLPDIKYIRNQGQAVYYPADMFRADDKWEFSEQDSRGTDIVLKNTTTGDQLIISSLPYSLPADGANKSEINKFYNALDNYVNSWGLGKERDLVFGITSNVLDQFRKGWEGNLNVANNLMKNFQNPDRIARLGEIADKYAGMIKAAKIAKNVFAGIGAFTGGWNIGMDILKTTNNDDNWERIMDAVSAHCDTGVAQIINNVAKDYKGQYDRKAWIKTAGDATMTGVGIASASVSELTFSLSLLITGVCYLGGKGLDYWSSCFTADDMRRKGDIRDLINKSCSPIKEGDPFYSLFPTLSPLLDPSGYVYEGVTSNRLEGVTATAYYKEQVEDMYGDLHENIVKWDAEEYAQENPLFTDENGMYAWDVPDGLWQVKFEKEGYETTYSDWLPVPPPQLDVNIAMKQNVQPNVKSARAYEDAVEVEFDKYMMPELLNTDNIIVMAGDKQVEGSIELLNEEAQYEGETETFASKLRFNASAPFEGTEVTLMVNSRVKSYAGIRMQDSYSQSFTIEQEIRKIVCDSATVVGYGRSETIPVTVLPASASAGKTINVRKSSAMILGTDVTSVVLDEEGKAMISVSGELPGTAALTFTVDGYDIAATTIVNVEQIKNVEIEAPKANIASGTTVASGTAIALSCATEGATIYYTIDGSCPCNEATRLVYTEPIIINKTVTIKAMSIAPDMTESEITEFTYIVDEEDAVDEITLDADLKIYPLPVRDKLNVTAGGKTIKSVTLTSMDGTTVVKTSKPVIMVTLDVSSLTPGIYIINVATEDKTYSRKILKIE